MLPTPKNYAIWPSVVPADTPTEMAIVPCEKAFLFFEGEEYTLTVISVNADEIDYHIGLKTHKKINVVAKDGVLRFTYAFPDEQEHLIVLEYGEKKLQTFNLYSLKEDMYRFRPFRGDFHAHSYRSDGKRDPSALMGHFREQGYDFLTLTDHNRFYPGGEIDETYDGVNLGISRVKGEEVHTPGSMIHIVHAGGNKSVAELYVRDLEKYEKDIEEYMGKVPSDIPEQYRERYAKVMWATDRIHEAGGIAIFPHPYWRPGASKIYNVRDEFAKILLCSGMFDAYELTGGMKQDGINRSIALWADLRAENGLRIPVVGSSDVHGLEKAETFPNLFTICFAENNDGDSLIEAVKSFRSVAVEASGVEYSREYRCYGSLRLVSYAQYLLKYYFPTLQRICQAEGVVMRAYAIENADAELIERLVERTENFKARFFGDKAPVFPSQNMIDFEDKWRKVQLDGPITKGSSITPPVTRQI